MSFIFELKACTQLSTPRKAYLHEHQVKLADGTKQRSQATFKLWHTSKESRYQVLCDSIIITPPILHASLYMICTSGESWHLGSQSFCDRLKAHWVDIIYLCSPCPGWGRGGYCYWYPDSTFNFEGSLQKFEGSWRHDLWYHFWSLSRTWVGQMFQLSFHHCKPWQFPPQ